METDEVPQWLHDYYMKTITSERDRAEAAEQHVRELERELREAESIDEEEAVVYSRMRDSLEDAEAKLATAVEALHQIDLAARYMDGSIADSGWAEIGRTATTLARQALSEIKGDKNV